MRLAQEQQTVAAMVRLYCRHHHTAPHPCADCTELLAYARRKLEACPFGDTKPACSKCPVHCYGTSMRQHITEVMRYAGPRMLLHHPVRAVRHLARERKPLTGEALRLNQPPPPDPPRS